MADHGPLHRPVRSRLGLPSADLSGLDLAGAVLTGAQLSGTNLQRAVLRGADLTNATLEDAECEGVDFEAAVLESARMSRIGLMRVNLKRANLAFAHLERATMPDVDLADADVLEAYLSDAYLGNANLSGANLLVARLERASFLWGRMSNVQLAGADLRHAKLWRADLEGAVLAGAALVHADLTEARLGGANLAGARLRGINLTRAWMGAATNLTSIVVGDDGEGLVLADIEWNEVHLATFDWTAMRRLGDESSARAADAGRSPLTPVQAYDAAARANQQVALQLQQRGMNAEAERFAFRARVMQRHALRRWARPRCRTTCFRWCWPCWRGTATVRVAGSPRSCWSSRDSWSAFSWRVSCHWLRPSSSASRRSTGAGFFPSQFSANDALAYVVRYHARSTTGDVPVGIRCVKFANLTERPGVPGVAFVWYGQGVVDKSAVRDRDGTPGHGIRCLLSSGSWLGAGAVARRAVHASGYLHRRPARTGPTGALRRRRHLPPTGILRIRAVGKMLVRPVRPAGPIEREGLGRWTEDWRLRHPAQSWRPAAEVAHLAVEIEP